MSTYKQIDAERRTLRSAVAKAFEDLASEAHRATDAGVAATLWKLAGRMESVMKTYGIEREMGNNAARRKA